MTEYWADCKKNRWKCVGITALICVLVFLCGSMGQDVYHTGKQGQQRVGAYEVLGELLEEGGDICLWAPREIMENARAYDGNIRLVYGRNMWDAALGAYSYETYVKEQELLYLWMGNASDTGMAEYIASDREVGEVDGKTEGDALIDAPRCLEMAKQFGVNRILLPGNLLQEELQKIVTAWGVEPIQTKGYYLFVL